MTVSIITPWLNQAKALIPDYEKAVQGAQVISVDNGSTPEDAAAIATMTARLGGVYIRNEENQGFAGANNQGYKAATGDIVIFLNSDIDGNPAWLKQVVADVQDGGLYGPALQAQLVYGMRLPYLEGWCVAATRATWERVKPNDHQTWNPVCLQGGPWDAQAFPEPYWEDNDLCLAALEKGFTLNQTAWALRHKGGQSAGSLVTWGQTFETNRATFAERVKEVWQAKQAAPKPKIYDCFTFYNELDLLEARLELLSDVVDTFIIVEATQTFTGQSKPLFYKENKARFARWASKIVHVVVDDMPDTSDPWQRETHQRNEILTGLFPLEKSTHDVVLISDVDEIPDPATLPREIEQNTVIALDQEFYYYSPRFRHKAPWRKALATTAAMLGRWNPQELRSMLIRDTPVQGVTGRVVTCGWHLSYFGNIRAIQTKIRAFSHQEYNRTEYTNSRHLAACLRDGTDLFGRAGVELEDIGDTANMPDVLRRLSAPVEV